MGSKHVDMEWATVLESIGCDPSAICDAASASCMSFCGGMKMQAGLSDLVR